MTMKKFFLVIGILTFLAAPESVFGQQSGAVNGSQLGGVAESDILNTITTAVPFLVIAPDARAAGFGDVGAATTPTANSVYWNMAKTAFSEESMEVSMSYTPWLSKLVNDINLAYISGYKKVNDRVAVGAGLRYFSLGDIQFTDQFGNDIRQFRPNEFAITAGVSAKLSENLSGGFNFRFINSNLTGGVTVLGANTKPGRTVASDLSLYYVKPNVKIFNTPAEWALGMNISNIGGKIAYSSTTNTDFLPTNLRIGPRVTFNLDQYNKITVAADINKLLVPTPPIYKRDSTGSPIPDGEGFEIGAGSDPNRSVISGMFGSFADAPGSPLVDEQGEYLITDEGEYEVEKGSVFREEMREINFGLGAEYMYDEQFAVRAGYFWEHKLKGNRKYFNVGLGLKFNFLNIDMSYLIPAYFGTNFQNSPLANTLRISLALNFAEMGKSDNNKES